MRFWITLTFVGIGSVAWPRAAPPVSYLEVGHEQVPWFTGPLLTPSAVNIPRGHYNLEPYVFATYQTSRYNSDWKKVPVEVPTWEINILPILQFGLTDWLDLTLSPSWFFEITKNSTSFNLGDFNLQFGLQILKQSKENWYPSIRLGLRESFPIGKFERLDPEQDGTDSVGSGAYMTTVVLMISRLIHLWDNHWMNIRFAFDYSVSAKVRIHGFSQYGGAFDANGWVYPPQSAQVFFAFEFNLTQRWVISYDAVAAFSKTTRFKGNPGLDEVTGLPADLTKGSRAQYSMAPALEYNWNTDLGLISGVWFTFAGRNSQAFTSWVTALNYYY